MVIQGRITTKDFHSKRARTCSNIAIIGPLQFWNPSMHMTYFLDLGPVPLPGYNFPWFLPLFLSFWFHLLNHTFISIKHGLSLPLSSLLSLLPAHRSLGGSKGHFYFVLSLSSLVQTGGASTSTILLKSDGFSVNFTDVYFIRQKLYPQINLRQALPYLSSLWGCCLTTPLRFLGLLSAWKNLWGSTLNSFCGLNKGPIFTLRPHFPDGTLDLIFVLRHFLTSSTFCWLGKLSWVIYISSNSTWKQNSSFLVHLSYISL